MSELGLLDLGKTEERQKPFVQLSSQKEEVKCEFGSKLKSQLIFATIHEPYCIFWYYLWVLLYYFS